MPGDVIRMFTDQLIYCYNIVCFPSTHASKRVPSLPAYLFNVFFCKLLIFLFCMEIIGPMLISKTVILTIKAALSTNNLYFDVGLFIDFSYYHQLGSFDM